jgi:hypothetical protein
LTTPSIAFSGIQEIEVTEDSNRTCIAPPRAGQARAASMKARSTGGPPLPAAAG